MKSIGQLVTAALQQPAVEEKKREQSAQVDVDKWANWFGFDLRRGTTAEATMRTMVRESALFCMRMKAKKEPYWLSFLGQSGAGKTYLAKRIFKWHSTCGHFGDTSTQQSGLPEVVYARDWCWWPKLAGLLKGNDGYGRLRDTEAAIFSVYDEIGAGLDKSGHVTDCLANALCSRVGKWTIITANKTFEEVYAQLDPRVASRMIRDGSVMLQPEVPDFAVYLKGRS